MPKHKRLLQITPIALGTTGALPFAVLLILIWNTNQLIFVNAFKAYGAIILCFLGAIHWGLAIGEHRKADFSIQIYVFSILPALCSWLAIMMNSVPGLILLTISFLIHLAGDRIVWRIFNLPGWYRRLRLLLTVTVVIMNLLAIVCLT